ncbi:MAG: terpene cyclase/mutase family protein [Deltaproteobacteria bacterium]|nr:terpene cyclase/mutase family protein [Deltaproteobacteria bacterium]
MARPADRQTPLTGTHLDAAVGTAIERGLDFLVSRQEPDGRWQGDYGGPMFLLPMYVAACRVTGARIPDDRRQGMIRYLLHAQNVDGGVGLHTEDAGSMFTTALSYVALRTLGLAPDDSRIVRMRAWIHANGTALRAASWGKLVLAVLNLYPYEGLSPILPELWLLPYAAPFHPGRLWCHCRQVYLPMAYLYGTRAAVPEDDLVRELRAELYDRPYEEIDFARAKYAVALSDARFPTTRVFRGASGIMGAFERLGAKSLRKRALDEVLEHIDYEDRATNHIDIGPVNSVLNTMVHHFREPGGERARTSFDALEEYLETGPDGVNFNGYNSTALWDTAFAVQSILATPHADRRGEHLKRAHRFIRDNQILEDLPDDASHYRHICRGGWPFSDRRHGWPITDCTAEGFKSAVALEGIAEEPIGDELLKDSVRLILSFQNRDGGFATYEKQRGGAWLELLNPSQVFGGIMVDYSYVECTSACLQALVRATVRFPGFLEREIARAVRRGAGFLRKKQRPDGGWQGAWAVCFTYGTWFGVSGLRAAGVPDGAPEIARACRFLLERQNPDGGWGEHHSSCVTGRYVPDQSRAAQTSWALMTLARAGLGNGDAARRAAAFLVGLQQDDGDWPKEPLVGVFNRTALINYENYRRYFPIWALAEFARAGGEVQMHSEK